MNNNMDQFNEMQELKKNISGIKNIIIVLSGKGGVGKSTISANLAFSLALNGKKTAILDTDLHGPSIPKLLNIENKEPQFLNDRIIPVKVSDNLLALSSGMLAKDENQPFIWRGPMKMGVIKQFLKDTEWGELDYLIIDSPPGTGDEPLSVIQLIPNITGAVIVTTPQDISLSDVKRSITFCKDLNVNILGVVENMSGFYCPECKTLHNIFKSGGAEKLNIEILAKLPLDPETVELSDQGKPFVYFAKEQNSVKQEFYRFTEKILIKTEEKKMSNSTEKNLKIAIPTAQGNLCMHFGHCEKFYICEVDNNKAIVNSTLETPPPHEPGVLPKWLGEKGVDVIISGGMGSRAQSLFSDQNIKVVTGACVDTPENTVNNYLNNTLQTGANACDH